MPVLQLRAGKTSRKCHDARVAACTTYLARATPYALGTVADVESVQPASRSPWRNSHRMSPVVCALCPLCSALCPMPCLCPAGSTARALQGSTCDAHRPTARETAARGGRRSTATSRPWDWVLQGNLRSSCLSSSVLSQEVVHMVP